METNLHHVFFQRRNYKTRAERQLRNNRAFVIPIDVEIHRDLHAQIPYVPKPTHDLIHGILNNLDNHLHRGLLDGVLYTVDYLDELNNKQAEKLSDCLTRQLGFLVMGVNCEWAEKPQI